MLAACLTAASSPSTAAAAAATDESRCGRRRRRQGGAACDASRDAAGKAARAAASERRGGERGHQPKGATGRSPVRRQEGLHAAAAVAPRVGARSPRDITAVRGEPEHGLLLLLLLPLQRL